MKINNKAEEKLESRINEFFKTSNRLEATSKSIKEAMVSGVSFYKLPVSEFLEFSNEKR